MRGNIVPGARAGVVLIAVVSAGSCSSAPARTGQSGLIEGTVITAAQIEQTGARTALEALRRSHHRFRTGVGRSGTIVHISRRGGLNEPLVVIDGAITEGLHALELMPAADIGTLRVLTGIDAVPRYGGRAAGGAIIIETRRGG